MNFQPKTITELRKKYQEYFSQRKHAVLPSASLIPENDSTTLFTGSGMQPLVPYLLGAKHPDGTRLTNSQQCFRAEDIVEVGDNRHTTFFEMLGNWSLGDYFKKEQLNWFAEFLTDVAGIDLSNIYVTVFAGDEKKGIPKDEESAKIWQEIFAKKGIKAEAVELLTEERGGELGMQGGRIFYYNAKKNWWSRAGVPENMPAGEPGGPDSEVFFEFKQIPHDEKFGKYCHPNCDCGRFMEIGNSVFMEYKKEENGSFSKLAQRNVDFGGGLERIMAASQNNADMFIAVDTLRQIVEKIEEKSGKTYSDNSSTRKSFRVIADHLRAVVFILSAGILPSNTDRGYVLRRLIRRMVRHSDVLNMAENSLAELGTIVVSSYSSVRPDLIEKENEIKEAIRAEEKKFRQTLKNGLQEFEKTVLKAGKNDLAGSDAFYFYQSFGFPKEIMQELCAENNIRFDAQGFEQEFEKHQEISRAGTAQRFAGGLADHSAQTTKLHTATHLLHTALRKVLGDHVQQKGSNITPERLRFDFSHPQKMTAEEISIVEKMVNEQIERKLQVTKEIMTPAEAKQAGALGFFEKKYGEQVSVYTAGDFSKEICGGPHVENTEEIGNFKIIKEEAVSAGIRRIKATI
jgi:alanyl-tRNA synthetase